jgi:mRNA-degrading endonuclease YafQ of YafQ-DinJ toxin-antitoxin module
MEYFYTARFLRSLKKMDDGVQDDIIRAVKLFETGKESETLKLHKLHGKFAKHYAFSANFSYRIIIKIEKSAMYYLDVGSHDVYK